MYYLYTEDFFIFPRFKNNIKAMLGKSQRGPQAVLSSLLCGLKEMGVDFAFNQKLTKPIEVACVLSGVKTLKWAIKQKKDGKIKKIIAGPNIVVTPFDYNGLMADPEIDIIIVPSEWNKNWWTNLNIGLKDKIKVWAAGVKDRKKTADPEGICLVYKKHVPEKVFKNLIDELKQQGIKHEILIYGKYRIEEYRKLLSRSKFMIYLTELESQGLALAEAWMAGVPTLVWNQGYFVYKNFRWQDEKISAPYLTSQAGMFFNGSDEFKVKFKEFLHSYNTFQPREYALNNFTSAVSAKKYLEILTS